LFMVSIRGEGLTEAMINTSQSKTFQRKAILFKNFANILEGPYKEVALGLAEVADTLAQITIQKPEAILPVKHNPSDRPRITGGYYDWFRRTHKHADCLDCGEPVAVENQFRHANAWHHGIGRFTITIKPDKQEKGS